MARSLRLRHVLWDSLAMISSMPHRLHSIALAAIAMLLLAAQGGMASTVPSRERAEEMRRNGCCCVMRSDNSCCCESPAMNQASARGQISSPLFLQTQDAGRTASPSSSGAEGCHCRSSAPPAPVERPKARSYETRNDVGRSSSSDLIAINTPQTTPKAGRPAELACHLLNSPLHLQSTRLLI